MLKLRSISKTEFDNYTNNENVNAHFMQTSAWGEFEKVTNHTTPHYLGLINENNQIIAATLLIEEHLPMNSSILYAPRGYVVDYKDKRLIYVLTKKLKDFAKTRKAIAIRINPTININIENNKKILHFLKELGYKRQSNIKLLEYNYTIDLTKDLKTIEKSYSSNIKEKIDSTEKYDIELAIGTQKDLEELFTLQKTTNKDYYETLYDILKNNEQTKIKLFIGKLHITKTLERELGKINNQISIIPIDNLDPTSKEKLANLRKQKEKVSKDLAKFKEYKLTYGNYLTISANLMMEHKKQVWVLSETSNNILDETNLRYTIYHEYIKHYKEQGFNQFNQLSPLEHNPNINEFKKEFGGEFTEYIGEYDLIINKLTYFIQKKIIPLFNKKQEDKNGTSHTN